MKKYKLKVYLIYIILFLLLAGVVASFFIVTNAKYYDMQTRDVVSSLNNLANKTIDQELNNTYNDFKIRVDQFSDSNDAYDDLMVNRDSIIIKKDINGANINFESFGLVYNDHYFINGVEYEYDIPYLQSTLYNQNVSIFKFSDVFTNSFGSNDKVWCFLKYRDVLGYFEAEPFFTMSLAHTKEYGNTYLISSDGHIYFNTDTTLVENKIANLIDDLNDSKKLFESIVLNARGTFNIKSKTESSYLIYEKLEHDMTNLGLTVVTIATKSKMVSSSTQVTWVSLVSIVGIGLIGLAGLFLFSEMLRRKDLDIELSRRTRLYAKPYIIEVDDNGNIKKSNETFVKAYGEVREKNLNDFKILDFEIPLSLEQQGNIILPFTPVNQVEGATIKNILFSVVSKGKGYILIGVEIEEAQKLIGKEANYLRYLMHELPNEKLFIKDIQHIIDYQLYRKQKISIVKLRVFKRCNSN